MLNGRTMHRTLLLAIGPAAAALALAAAYAGEHLAGLRPCPLCLLQRWPYWAAVGLGAVALLLPRRFTAPALAILALLFLGNAGLAALHAGVEWGFWPSPLRECAAPAVGAAATVEDLLRALAPLPAVPCDEAALRVLGLSMAGWNALFALALGGFLTISAARLWRTP
ncbi:MAG: disulfide bond formation protein B [Acetobacteraceae bacterium]